MNHLQHVLLTHSLTESKYNSNTPKHATTNARNEITGTTSTTSSGGIFVSSMIRLAQQCRGTVHRTGYTKRKICLVCERIQKKRSSHLILVTLVPDRVRLVFDVQQTSCTISMEEKVNTRRWDPSGGMIRTDSVMVRVDHHVQIDVPDESVLFILKFHTAPTALKDRFKAIHSKRSDDEVEGRSQKPEYLLQFEGTRQMHSTRKFMLSAKNMYVVPECICHPCISHSRIITIFTTKFTQSRRMISGLSLTLDDLHSVVKYYVSTRIHA